MKDQIYRATEDYEQRLEEHSVERDRLSQHYFQCKTDMAQLLTYRNELELLLEQSTNAIEMKNRQISQATSQIDHYKHQYSELSQMLQRTNSMADDYRKKIHALEQRVK